MLCNDIFYIYHRSFKMEPQTVSCLFIALSIVNMTSTETGHSTEMPDCLEDSTHTLKSFFFLIKEIQLLVIKSYVLL